MLEQDYLMRLIIEFTSAIRRSMDRAAGEHDAVGAAKTLDSAVGAATDFDAETLLSLAPESIASVLQVSGVDPKLTGFMARSLLLSSVYYAEGGQSPLADLRRAQAQAVASAFGHELDDDAVTPEELERYFEQAGIDL